MTDQGCNATLTTATVEPCPDLDNGCDADECMGRIGHITLNTLTCVGDYVADCGSGHHHHGPTYWTDNSLGATSHVEPEPEVTDAELTAAMYAWMGAGGSKDRKWAQAQTHFRAALAAAYAIHDKGKPVVNSNPLHDWHWCVDEQEVHHVADVCTYPQGRHDLYVTRFPIDKEQTDE